MSFVRFYLDKYFSYLSNANFGNFDPKIPDPFILYI